MKYTTQQKIIRTEDALRHWLAKARFKGKKIVFSNGCFDILHLGHIDYLEQAKALGDLLVIGVNTDASIKRLKGESRPLQGEESRYRLVAALEFVDAVIPFDTDTPAELIAKVIPDVLVKGNDYKPEDIAGYSTVKENEGEVITIPLTEGYSTTNIIRKILSANGKA